MASDLAQKYIFLLTAIFVFPFIDMIAALIDYNLFIRFHIAALNALIIVGAVLFTALKHGFSFDSLVNLSKFTLALWGVAIIIAVLSCLFSGGDPYRTLVTLVLIATAPALAFLLKQDGRALADSILNTIVISFGIYSTFFLTIFLSGLYHAPYPDSSSGTFPGFGNIRHVADILAPVAILGVFIWAGDKSPSNIVTKILRVFLISMIWTVVLFSGSRTGVLAVLIGLLVTFSITRNSRGRIIRYFALTIFLGALFASTIPSNFANLGFWQMFDRTSDIENVQDLSSNRTLLWVTGLKESINKPFIGHGIGTFWHVSEALGLKVAQAHNAIVEYYYALGIVGGTCLIIAMVTIWVRIMLFCRSTAPLAAVAACAAVNVIIPSALLNGVFFHYNPILLSVVLFTIALSTPVDTRTANN